MNVVDIAIVLLLVLSAILGYRSGLIQSVASLVGLVAGIAIASWNFPRLADWLLQFIHSVPLSEAVAFCLIALLIMVIAGLIGMLLKKVIHGSGLGWLDKLCGFIFGLLRGGLLVVLCIVTLAAFFPDTRWLGDSQLGKYFLGTAHVTSYMSPDELKQRILKGLRVLEADSPKWLHGN